MSKCSNKILVAFKPESKVWDLVIQRQEKSFANAKERTFGNVNLDDLRDKLSALIGSDARFKVSDPTSGGMCSGGPWITCIETPDSYDSDDIIDDDNDSWTVYVNVIRPAVSGAT